MSWSILWLYLFHHLWLVTLSLLTISFYPILCFILSHKVLHYYSMPINHLIDYNFVNKYVQSLDKLIFSRHESYVISSIFINSVFFHLWWSFLCFVFSQKDAEMCIYDASCETHFGFCCVVDEQVAREIACMFTFFPFLLFILCILS